MSFRSRLTAASVAALIAANPALAGPDFKPGNRGQYASPNYNAPDVDRLIVHGTESTGEIPKMSVGGVPLGAVIGRQNGKTVVSSDVVTGDGSGVGIVPNAPNGIPGLALPSRPLADFAASKIDARDAGAPGNGVGDDQPAIQALANKLGATRTEDPGGHLRMPSGKYRLGSPVYSGRKVGYELDSGVCFQPITTGVNVIVPDVISPVITGSCNAVKTLAGFASEPDSSVLLIAQTQPRIPANRDGSSSIKQQQAFLIRQVGYNDEPVTSGLVGGEVQQQLGEGIVYGTMWGWHVLNTILKGQKPYNVLAEFELKNDSELVQPKVGAPYPQVQATIGINLNNLGNTVSTAGLTFSGGGGWRYGTLCAQPAVRVWCLATVNTNHDPVAGTTVGGKAHAQSFGIGTATAAENSNGTVSPAGVATFATADGAGGVALTASTINLRGTQLEAAWTGYAPTLSAQSGSITPVGGAGAYKVIGKTVQFRVAITINDRGTAAGALYLGLPVPAKDHSYLGGVEQVSFTGLAGYVQPGQSSVILKTAAGAFPLSGTGPWLLVVSGTYETP